MNRVKLKKLIKNNTSNSHSNQEGQKSVTAQRAYRALSACHREVIRAGDEKDLLPKICQVIVNEGGYRRAWIGFSENDENKTIRAVAQSADTKEYPDKLNITWADKKQGRGPTITAIRTGRPFVVRKILTDNALALWRSEAIRLNYASLVSIPLIAGNQSLGALNIYAAESDAFDDEEVKLLTDLADDFVYGIMSLRANVEKRRAEEDLRNSEKKYRELVENAPVGVYRTDIKGKIVFANEGLARMLEFESAEELMASSVLERYRNQEDRKNLIDSLRRDGKVTNYDLELLTKSGGVRNVILSASLDGDIISGMIRDITDRMQTEKKFYHTLEILRKTLGATIQALNKIVESRDPYTAGHQKRVADLARAIATEMGLSEDAIDGIRIAGLLHDIGKISVPSEILSKSSKLNEYEFNLIKEHPRIGFDILSTIEFPWPVAIIILQHHERMDGSGYPQGLAGDDILMESRILGVADVVEAMTSHRPYRPAIHIGETLKEISDKKGILYDPRVVEACLRLFNEKNLSFREQA
jgi:PAS domain S-box-containing protein/putative nucleotidyltransferase with HDIG domain